MRNCFFLLFFILCYSCYAYNSQDDILKRLDMTIARQQDFKDVRECQIEILKQQLKTPRLTPEQQYEINSLLYYKYNNYQCDSAIYYADRNLSIAIKLDNREWMDETNMQLAGLFIIVGMYSEARELLGNIQSDRLDRQGKIQYYNRCKELFKNQSYNNIFEKEYCETSDNYRDSLLSLLDPSSYRYRIVYAEKIISENNLSEAKEMLLGMFDSTCINHEFAQVTYSIARVYSKEKNTTSQNKYFALSAIADIENSVKENVSLQLLAFSLYELGDISRAYRYIDYSLKDAIFCNAYIRTVSISKIYPIIEISYKEEINKQKKQLTFFLTLIGFLSFFLIMTVLYLYRQIKKVALARKGVSDVNQQLRELNGQLQTSNINLFEANRIKDEYIGRFFDLCSVYIDKLDNYRKTLNKKASEHQMEELFRMLKSKDIIRNELSELYSNFDNTFLRLFPSFVEEFNSLLRPEEHFVLKQTESMSVEIRIFALIRLGITDSSKIAAFLRYSPQTIYNYRSKAKTKAVVPVQDFEKMIMKIGLKEN